MCRMREQRVVAIHRGPTKLLIQERHVERCAVVADEQRVFLKGFWQLVQILAPDERRKPCVVDDADHRYVRILRRQAGRLDVQERSGLLEVGVKPPALSGSEDVLKVTGVPVIQPLLSLLEYLFVLRLGRRELVPGSDTSAPQFRLPFGSDTVN